MIKLTYVSPVKEETIQPIPEQTQKYQRKIVKIKCGCLLKEYHFENGKLVDEISRIEF